MTVNFQKIAQTDAVRQAQEHYYGHAQPQRDGAPVRDTLTEDEIEFIRTRDSFYMASVSETGWPYIQHRGGPPGFLHVLNPQQLAFADLKGNRQLLTTGNVSKENRVALFLMDYPHKARLKILGHARVEDASDHADLVARLAEPGLQGGVERLFFIDLVSFDWNCPQHITPRYNLDEIKEDIVAPLQQRIAELEAEINHLKKEPQ